VVTPRRFALALVVGALSLLGDARRVDAHPMHSTMTEIAFDPARGTVRATIRVFADDLRAALSAVSRGRPLPPDGPVWDAAVAAYAISTFGLQDARGRTLTLRSCAVRRTADLLWLCVEADVARDAGALQVRNAMLCDVYADQVNVVQGMVGGTRSTLLFVRGDRFKVLR
jgi:hypothetical protein